MYRNPPMRRVSVHPGIRARAADARRWRQATKGGLVSVSYSHGASDIPLLGETIGANLERTVARFPDHEALVSRHQNQRFTYAELNDWIDRLARGLLDAGLEPGDRVGMWSPNYAEWVAVQYATAKIGVIIVNMNPAYRSHEVEEVSPTLDALERAICLSSPEWNTLLSAGQGVPMDRLRDRMAALDFDDAI